MDILKMSLRIVFLVLLCIPIAYIEYYIVKNTISDVMNSKKKNLSKSTSSVNNYYRNEHLKVAK